MEKPNYFHKKAVEAIECFNTRSTPLLLKGCPDWVAHMMNKAHDELPVPDPYIHRFVYEALIVVEREPAMHSAQDVYKGSPWKCLNHMVNTRDWLGSSLHRAGIIEALTRTHVGFMDGSLLETLEEGVNQEYARVAVVVFEALEQEAHRAESE